MSQTMSFWGEIHVHLQYMETENHCCTREENGAKNPDVTFEFIYSIIF